MVDLDQDDLIALLVGLIRWPYERTSDIVLSNPWGSFFIADLLWLELDPVIREIADINGMQL